MKQAVHPYKNRRGFTYRPEVKEFIQRQALAELTTKEIKEKCNARFPEYEFTDQKIRDFIRNHRIKRIKSPKSSVMTPEERSYAENNINIIYDYLHKNRLEIDEWFDIAVFGYLDAVMKYHRQETLRRYAFTTISWHSMKKEISNYRTRMQAEKRSCEIKSLDAGIEGINNKAGRYEAVPDQSSERLYHDFYFWYDVNQIIGEKLNKEQQKQLYLLYCEYKPGEIADMLGISKEKQKRNKAYIQLVFSKSGMLPPLHRCNHEKSLLAATRQALN